MATIDDVARRAGVAPSTVSYVLSGNRRISTATRARVEAAITALGYHPHAGARALASARTNVIAVLVPLPLSPAGTGLRSDIDVNVIMQFVAGIAPTARRMGYDVLLVTDEDPDAAARVWAGSTADAIIAMDVQADDPRLQALSGAKTPSILIGLPDDPHGLSCVDFDFEAAGRSAVRHLTALGHEHIAMLGPPPTTLERRLSYAERMLRGLNQQADSAQVRLSVASAAGRRDCVAEALLPLLAGTNRATALIIHNEAALPSALEVIRSEGLRIPDDISIIAVCPPNVAEQQAIPLSSIDIPAQQIGATSVEMLIANLQGETAQETRLVRTDLTARGSLASIGQSPDAGT